MSWRTIDYMCTNQDCTNKEVKVELLVKVSQQDSQVCELCGKTLTRLFGVGGIKTSDNSGRMKV